MSEAETMSTDAAIESSELKEEYASFVGRKVLFLLLSILGIAILAGIAATLGSAEITPVEVYSAILARLFPGRFEATDFVDTIVWQLRLHRVLMGIFAGMGLAVAGAAMQGILKNPLASPFTLGIASAASFGASLAIILGAGFVGGGYLIVGNAFIFTMLASVIVYGLARYKGITPETMILAGIAIMYLFSAMTSFLQYVGESEEVHEVVFWMMGSLGRSSWDKVAIIALITMTCTLILMAFSWDINALGAG
ncbi:MAG TPA: iron ABC transporter permease, partial [Methanothrix sp.]|nr:iron ABC transporter permease [Methanothrix sp.]